MGFQARFLSVAQVVQMLSLNPFFFWSLHMGISKKFC